MDKRLHRDRGVHVDPENIPPGLLRTEMTRDEKAFHLDSIGIRGTRAKEILDQIFGKEPT